MLFAFHKADDHPIAQLKTVGPSAAVVLGLCIGAMLLSVKVLYSAPSRSDCHGAASIAYAARDRALCWLLAKAGPGFSFSTRGERREGMWVLLRE